MIICRSGNILGRSGSEWVGVGRSGSEWVGVGRSGSEWVGACFSTGLCFIVKSSLSTFKKCVGLIISDIRLTK